MKWLRGAIVVALLVLALGTGAAYLSTRDAEIPRISVAETQRELVDQRPLQTAHRLAPLAVTPEELRLAQEAARLGDHAVDLAFADALMEAAEHTAETDPKNRALYARIQKIQTTLAEEQTHIDQLKVQLA